MTHAVIECLSSFHQLILPAQTHIGPASSDPGLWTGLLLRFLCLSVVDTWNLCGETLRGFKAINVL